jgi:Tfp pilus assembly protein PilF
MHHAMHIPSVNCRKKLNRLKSISLGLVTVAFIAGSPITSHAQKTASQPEAPLQEQLHRALSVFEHGDIAQALKLTNRLVEQHPGFVPALKLQGMLLEETGRPEKAAQSYQRGLKLAPNDADLLFKVGVEQLLAGDKSQAITLLLRHLRYEPRDGDAFYYLAQAYHLSGQNELALNAIQKCVKYLPANPSALQKYGELLCSTGDSETGIGWLLKAQQIDPKLEQIDLDLGIASLSDMDLPNADKYAQVAIGKYPSNPDAWELLASVEVKLAQWQKAKDAYQQVLSLKQEEPDALLGLGHCELELKQYRDAIDTLNGLLRRDPTKILAHFYLSRAYAGQGDRTEAQHQAELHHTMMEQISFAASALGSEADKAAWVQARRLLIDHREEQALQLFVENAKRTSATPGHPYFLIGALYLYIGDSANGLRYLNRALQIEPTVRGARTYLGIYDLQQGRLAEAEKEFLAEIANDPNYETAVAELGVVRYKQQRWAEAADQLARSHTRTPALLLPLCDAYFHLDNVKDANLTAEIAAAYARDDPQFLESLIDLLNHNGQAELAQKLAGTPRP